MTIQLEPKGECEVTVNDKGLQSKIFKYKNFEISQKPKYAEFSQVRLIIQSDDLVFLSAFIKSSGDYAQSGPKNLVKIINEDHRVLKEFELEFHWNSNTNGILSYPKESEGIMEVKHTFKTVGKHPEWRFTW